MAVTEEMLARHGALLERAAKLERALEKISVLAGSRLAQERPRIALEDVADLADRALGEG